MIHLSKIWLILVLFLTLPSACFSGTIDPSLQDNKYLKYAEDFKYIVSISGIDNKGGMFSASAVLIDDHHVLTAAHVVKDAELCLISIGDAKYILSKITTHKDYNETFGVADIALGYCKQKFNLDFYPELYCGNDEIGKVCSIAGYGFTGNFNTGATRYDGKKRAGSNMINSIEKDLLLCDPSYRHDKKCTSLEFFIGSGDSGGGLFIDGKLAGINSCILSNNKTTPKSKYGEESGHTRVSKFVEWINENKTKVD